MDYIGPRGISLSTWNTWTDYDQAAALAWVEWDNAKCHAGHHPKVWDPGQGGELLKHLQPGTSRCLACASMENAQRKRAEESSSDPLPGTFWTWVPKKPSAEQQDAQHPDRSEEDQSEQDDQAEVEQQ